MSVLPLEHHDAETIAAALVARVELDDGDADLENELVKFGVGGGQVPAPQRAPGPRANRYKPARQHGAVQEVADDSDGLIGQLAKAHDQRTLGDALHARLVADGDDRRAANVLATLKSFSVL